MFTPSACRILQRGLRREVPAPRSWRFVAAAYAIAVHISQGANEGVWNK